MHFIYMYITILILKVIYYAFNLYLTMMDHNYMYRLVYVTYVNMIIITFNFPLRDSVLIIN